MTDRLGFRKKIGIVVPSTNTVVQPESEVLRPRGVTNHIGRLTVKERPLVTEQAFMEHVAAMREGIGAAIDQVMTCAPDHLIMGVALEAFWGGVAAADRLQADLAARAGVGVSMGSTATVAALEAFGARKIAVLTPHQPRGDEMVRAYFVEAGYELIRLKGLKCASPTMIAQVTESELIQALGELDGPDIDALVQVGTNLPNLDIAAAAERWFGKPVLSINAVTYWDALRRMGIPDRVYGFGRILEEF
jgi:maleate isomerase